MPYKFKTGKVMIDTTAPVKILEGFVAPEGMRVVFRVTGASVVVGDENVTAATGFDITSLGTGIVLTSYGPADLYGISTSGTATLTYFLYQTVEVPCD